MRFHLSVLTLALAYLPAFASASSDGQMAFVDPAYPAPLTHPAPSLADLLTIDPSLSIFYSYARETELSKRFADLEGVQTTVLAPKNKAVMSLARKPHQGTAPVDDRIIVTEAEFDQQSKANVERWISSHIIPSLIPLSAGSFDTLLSGKAVSFTETKADRSSPAWKHFLLEGGIEILDMKRASNGVIYVIDGTVKPE